MVKLLMCAIALTDVKETAGAWSELVQMVGVPVGILIVLGVALWRTARWLRPWVELVLKSHLEFVNGTAQKLDQLCTEVKGHTNSVDQLVDHLRRKAG